MPQRKALLDRFGDLEFLRELWEKAKKEIPERMEELGSMARATEGVTSKILGQKLHKMRGLISNFLTDDEAVPQLIRCELLVESEKRHELPAMWDIFESKLNFEVDQLERFLQDNGF